MVLGVFGPNGGCIQLGSRQNPPWGQVMDFLRKLVPLYNVPCIQGVTLDVGTQHGFNAVGHKSVVVL